MRTYGQLYKIVLDNFEHLKVGICNLISHISNEGIISEDEYLKLIEHFEKQMPKGWRSILWGTKREKCRYGYWWPTTEEGNEWRRRFLKHLARKYRNTPL